MSKMFAQIYSFFHDPYLKSNRERYLIYLKKIVWFLLNEKNSLSLRERLIQEKDIKASIKSYIIDKFLKELFDEIKKDD